MKYTDEQIRKKIHRKLIAQNEFDSFAPEKDPAYLDMAKICGYSLINNHRLPCGRRISLLTVVFDGLIRYDVFCFAQGRLVRISRDGCCASHCNTWDDSIPVMMDELALIKKPKAS